MASKPKTRQSLLVVTLAVCTLILGVTSAGDEDDYVPGVGIIGEHHGEDRGYYGGSDEDHGTGSDDPTHIVDGALICFHKKHIYSECDESCRLTVNGELHVPHDKVDEFCNGPCIEETNHVLDCIDEIMDHFFFFNKATTKDIRDTILAGCGHGDQRGDFDVAEHIEAYGNIGHKAKNSVIVILFSIVFSIIAQVLLVL